MRPCQFRHDMGRDAHAPGFYLHLGPDEVRFRGGPVDGPDPDALLRMRTVIARKTRSLEGRQHGRQRPSSNGWARVRGECSWFGRRAGFDPAHAPFIDDLRRKSFFFTSNGDEALARTPALVD